MLRSNVGNNDNVAAVATSMSVPRSVRLFCIRAITTQFLFINTNVVLTTASIYHAADAPHNAKSNNVGICHQPVSLNAQLFNALKATSIQTKKSELHSSTFALMGYLNSCNTIIQNKFARCVITQAKKILSYAMLLKHEIISKTTVENH